MSTVSSEHLLISKVIQTGSVTEVINAGIKPAHFSPNFGRMWLWILDYWRTHGSVPTSRAFKQEFADVLLMDASLEPFSALIDEIYEAYKREHLIESIASAMPALNNNQVEEAFKALSEGLQRASTETAHLRDVDLVQTWESRLEYYEEIRNTPNSLRGLPTGFAGLDRLLAGLRPQQLITFVGEAKKGKSLITLIMARAAHLHGVTPLYVSFEMSNQEQSARYDSIISGVPHTRIMRGDLSSRDMEKIKKALTLHKNMHPFIMTEDSASLTTVSALAGKVQQYRPSIVFVDGVYLMEDEQGQDKGTPQALTNITRALKRLAQRFDIPIVVTTQVLSWKLGNKKTRQVSADAIGYTSSFAQDSDVIISVESDPDIDDQAILRILLARTAPKGEFHIKWDWENMDFTEVDEHDDSGNWYY